MVVLDNVSEHMLGHVYCKCAPPRQPMSSRALPIAVGMIFRPSRYFNDDDAAKAGKGHNKPRFGSMQGLIVCLAGGA